MRHATPLHIVDRSLWRPGYDCSILQCRTMSAVVLRKVSAYIKLDLDPYDVTLEWMKFMWSSYLYNERNLRHVAIVLSVHTSRRWRHTVLINSSSPSWADDSGSKNDQKTITSTSECGKTFPRHTEDMDHYNIDEIFSSPLSYTTNGLLLLYWFGKYLVQYTATAPYTTAHSTLLVPWGQSQIASTIFAYDSIIMIYDCHVPLTECDLLRTFETMNDMIEISVVKSTTRIARNSTCSSTRLMWPK